MGIQRQFQTKAPPDAREDTSIEELQRQFSTQAPPDARQDASIEEFEQEPPIKNDPPFQNEMNWNHTKNEDGDYQVGDMIFTEEQFKLRYGTEEERKAILDRQGRPGDKYRWKNNELAYDFSSTITEANKEKVRTAMADFNAHLSGCFTIR